MRRKLCKAKVRHTIRLCPINQRITYSNQQGALWSKKPIRKVIARLGKGAKSILNPAISQVYKEHIPTITYRP